MLCHNKKSRYTSESWTSLKAPGWTRFLPLTDHGRCVIVVVPWTRDLTAGRRGGLCNTIRANDKTSERSCKDWRRHWQLLDQSCTREDHDLGRYPGLPVCVFRFLASIALYACVVSPRNNNMTKATTLKSRRIIYEWNLTKQYFEHVLKKCPARTAHAPDARPPPCNWKSRPLSRITFIWVIPRQAFRVDMRKPGEESSCSFPPTLQPPTTPPPPPPPGQLYI